MTFDNWGAGWAVSSASNQPILPIAISMVLALVLLELHNVLHKGYSVFCIEVDIFKFGESEKAQECLM